MCGRVRSYLCASEVSNATGRTYCGSVARGAKGTDETSSGSEPSRIENCAPGSLLYVCTGDDIVAPMRWGLIPRYHTVGEKLNHFTLMNCRSETMGSSRIFGTLLREGKRCVAVLNGYFEWKSEGKNNKQPYYVFPAKGDLFFMAGLYDEWQGNQTLTLLTSGALSPLDTIHHRQPVQLWDVEGVNAYIRDGTMPDQTLTGRVSFHQVTREVGKISFQDASCTKQVRVNKIQNFFGNVTSTFDAGATKPTNAVGGTKRPLEGFSPSSSSSSSPASVAKKIASSSPATKQRPTFLTTWVQKKKVSDKLLDQKSNVSKIDLTLDEN